VGGEHAPAKQVRAAFVFDADIHHRAIEHSAMTGRHGCRQGGFGAQRRRPLAFSGHSAVAADRSGSPKSGWWTAGQSREPLEVAFEDESGSSLTSSEGISAPAGHSVAHASALGTKAVQAPLVMACR
jgi:hypothetical protein